jgi:hypothetical protein
MSDEDTFSWTYTPVRDLWEMSYPFELLDRKIERLEPEENYLDRHEAFELMLQLQDIYVHILCANIRNPYQPWEMVTERMFKHDIMETLDLIKKEVPGVGERFDLRELTELPEDEGFKINPTEEWEGEIDEKKMLIGDFLGCSSNIDEDNKEVELNEDPEMYIETCNAIINSWEGTHQLWNDIKHSYRLLPFDWNTMDYFRDIGFVGKEHTDMEAKKERFEEGVEEGKYYFWRFETTENDEGVEEAWLTVYEVQPEECLKLAEITLKLLHNLFGRREDGNEVVDDMKEVLNFPDNVEFSPMDQLFGAQLNWGELPDSYPDMSEE